jgi:hypothetical protein
VGERLEEQRALAVGQLGEDGGLADLLRVNQVSSSASCTGTAST